MNKNAVNDLLKSFPVGCRVRVIASDEDIYVGETGTVVDYDTHEDYDAPLAGVLFDEPAFVDGDKMTRDGFYIDELERI